MPYLYLAESYNELDLLANLVSKIENIDKPLKELDEECYLIAEFNRIKFSASRDVLIFGTYADHYLNFHLCQVYGLHIRVIDILKELGDKLYLCNRESYMYKYCTILHVEMGNLAVFYEKLSKVRVRFENR
ncbi:hypothetical protein H7F33_07385 [Pedobacter sp. PAMC26386]|nr:hypothetical protein H7F33_07385 [Pedobacter sp. PAMC26386]